MLEKGKKVGEYVLLQKIGAGAFGDVWKAEKRTLLDVNQFALKFFRPDDKGRYFEKIGKEIGVWKQLKGLPHIISVIELDSFDDYIYVVSDFADGGSLEKWIRNRGGRASSEKEAVEITLEILTGLENLHAKGFVHRDLKPDNILIMNGKHCLADFGITREIKTYSKATNAAGTLQYMPPEAFEKQPSVTVQTDIWAVGVILQRLLTGDLPYPQEDQASLIAAVLMHEPERMPAQVPEILHKVVKKALQKERERRFKTATEMREVLQHILRNGFSMKSAPAPEKKPPPAETPVLNDPDKTAVLEISPTQNPSISTVQNQPEPEFQSVQTVIRPNIQPLSPLNAPERRTDQAPRVVTAKTPVNRPTAVAQNQPKSAKIWIGALVFFVILGSVIGVIYWSEGGSGSAVGALPANVESVKNSFGMEFVKIPAGSFVMGAPAGEKDSLEYERPQRRVTISKDFYLGRFEVTQGQWAQVMGGNPSNFRDCGDNCPIEAVNWDDVQNFLTKLNSLGDGTYRLPTEAEWELAARAGSNVPPTADEIESSAWYYKNSGDRIHPVGQKSPNAFGLHDIYGNVWEWTSDWYADYTADEATDPIVSEGKYRVARGGGFGNTNGFLRPAFRFQMKTDERLRDVGLRIVKEQ